MRAKNAASGREPDQRAPHTDQPSYCSFRVILLQPEVGGSRNIDTIKRLGFCFLLETGKNRLRDLLFQSQCVCTYALSR